MTPKRRTVYPRVNCLAPGCKRGTTRCEPHKNGAPVEWICGTHYQQVPKVWRQRLSLYRRRYFAAERKGDHEGMAVASRVFWRRWERIVALVQNPASVTTGEGLPIGMADELRRMGL